MGPASIADRGENLTSEGDFCFRPAVCSPGRSLVPHNHRTMPSVTLCCLKAPPSVGGRTSKPPEKFCEFIRGKLTAGTGEQDRGCSGEAQLCGSFYTLGMKAGPKEGYMG